MNKLVATCLESKIFVYDMRTQHPTEGFACATEKVRKANLTLDARPYDTCCCNSEIIRSIFPPVNVTYIVFHE